ncbi:hypothetical protein C8R46DRAFT_1085767 [Mycena filopes]|nr:hypothetical protein C8R46DRAFT_1085767 [Mycena filopes]
MSQNVTYDDRDSALQYSPGWFRTGTYNATSVGQTGTLASSLITSGVNVTFVFPSTTFPFCVLARCCGGSYLICIDCDPNNRQFETIDAVNRTDDGQNPPITLDKFILAIPDPAAIQTESPSTTLPVLTSQPGPTTASAQNSSTSKSTPRYLVPLLSGILGGLALLLMLVCVWLFIRRKYRQPVQNEEAVADDSESLWGPSSRFTASPLSIRLPSY